MRKIFFCIATLFVFLTSHFAQVNGIGWAAKFGAAAGYTPMWIFPDTKVLNSQLGGWGVGKLSEDGMFVSAGSGYVYLAFLKNIRIGGIGFSGNISESSSLNDVNKELNYSVSGGGVTIEYTMPFIKKIGVSVGIALGAGKTEINMYQNLDEFNWDLITEQLSDSDINNQNFYLNLQNNYYLFIPTLNIDIPINKFFAFRTGAGYQMIFGTEWKANNDQNISGLPDDLNSDAFFVQAGVLVGFFAF